MDKERTHGNEYLRTRKGRGSRSLWTVCGQSHRQPDGRRFTPHGFRVIGVGTARFLILINPGGFEGFVTEMGEPASALRLPEPSAPGMEKLVALAAKYRIEILGPLRNESACEEGAPTSTRWTSRSRACYFNGRNTRLTDVPGS